MDDIRLCLIQMYLGQFVDTDSGSSTGDDREHGLPIKNINIINNQYTRILFFKPVKPVGRGGALETILNCC